MRIALRCHRHDALLIKSPFFGQHERGEKISPRVCLTCIEEAREKIALERWRASFDQTAGLSSCETHSRAPANWFEHWPSFRKNNSCESR